MRLPKRRNLTTLRPCTLVDWRLCRTQEKGRPQLYAVERLTQNALLQRFDINDDVRKFRHGWLKLSTRSIRRLRRLHRFAQDVRNN